MKLRQGDFVGYADPAGLVVARFDNNKVGRSLEGDLGPRLAGTLIFAVREPKLRGCAGYCLACAARADISDDECSVRLGQRRPDQVCPQPFGLGPRLAGTL